MKHLYSILFLFITYNLSAQNINIDSLSKHVHFLASEELQGRALGTEGKDKATTYIVNQFERIGLIPYKNNYLQHFDLNFKLAWVKAKNIIGFVEGIDPELKNEFIVLGAHYDHLGPKKDKSTFYPGADDNASGVATIIELARYFQQHKPKRSIVFIAFDAEESGLLGSKHFVKQLDINEKNQIKAMFSYDMVGMLNKNNGLNLKGIASLVNGKEVAQKHAQDINLLDLSSDIEERTDTEPFGLTGIPAIHVFTGLKSPYHKPEDKANLLDYPGMKKVADYTAKVIADLANEEFVQAARSMEAVKSDPKKINKPFSLGATGYFGFSRHLYNDEFYDAKEEVAYSIGFYANYKFSKRWAINVEALFDENTSQSVEGKFFRHSLLIPANVEFGNLLYINAGAYYKHHFSGKDGDIELDFNNQYRSNEWGYNYGVGLKFNKLRFGWLQRNSLQSIFKQTSKVIPNAVYFNLSYKF
ncbi:M20/M25/M40 family metallo-hydrolase [Sphingobacterium bovistauri]|uniref:M20/M25/M40 family metallo-hydrolase n=1 Tax=Sphingobacterium bovistauri TaxID=2781959 RepID=A0ABS7Z2W1_9SPHI|nr:M20/M25/M40 family metallo-hydrolase [Sphingobacterium bovistauri]MCA5004308.1 M20/M25/M40 family metallo-hydrolase [Sphingobacterium bovistauri]